MSMMDVMKAVADIEKTQEVSPRRVPSPRVTNGIPSAKKSSKVSKKSTMSKIKQPEENVNIEEELFKDISNPGKMCTSPVKNAKQKTKKNKKEKKKNKQKAYSVSSYGSSMSSIGADSDVDSFGSMDDMSDMSDDRSGSSNGSYDGREEFTRKKRKEEIMQEKIEMLTRISKMSKQGFTATKRWTLKDDIDEIRFECYRMTRESNSKKSVKSMQHILITVATIVEFANNIVNPFNLKLQGFSKNMMLTVSDYDDSLEELHHKWSGRTSIGPEMTILFTFVTSAVFHHAGNVMNSPAPSSESTKSAPEKKKMPDMSSVLGMFSNMIPKTTKPTPTASSVYTTSPSTEDKAETIPKKRKPMKGPSASMSNLMPSMMIP